MAPEKREAVVTALGWPPFRARQLSRWLDSGVTDLSKMTDLPEKLREQLAERYMAPGVEISRRLVSAIDGTVKYLFSLSDGETVEWDFSPRTGGFTDSYRFVSHRDL